MIAHFIRYTYLVFSLCLGLNVFAQTDSQLKLAQAASDLQDENIYYDPAYFSISYPMGDIPSNKGVCTDVVVRAYRKLGFDLQELVHEDMQLHFKQYPAHWGLSQPDPNIDHRRVPNLMYFFTKNGKELPLSNKGSDYKPGDIVCWDLGAGILHIGIVLNRLSADGERPLVMHNIGGGQVAEDILFAYDLIGHYRYPFP